MSVINLNLCHLLEVMNLNNLTFISPFLCLTLMILLLSHIFMTKPSRKVYLLNFACYKPPLALLCSKEVALERARRYANLSEETLVFMEKTLERSGLGDSTYLPEAYMRDPPNICLEEARREAEMVMFGAIDELLVKTRVKCMDIGILVVNCCIFNVVPSLSTMVVNHYKLRDNIVSYNIGGMGCSAGLSAISLAKQLLQVHHNTYALVVSTENITQNFYMGSDRSKSLINCAFRVGGAAILLSNRPSDRPSSKFQLIHTVQTNTAHCDRSYKCIIQEEDQEGHLGVTVTRDLMAVAIKAVESNMTALGRLVLPVSEQILYITNYLIRHLHVAEIKPYAPDFKKAFDHIFPHVGGKPVLDELQRNLGLSDKDMEASRMTLYRFGNTSSSTVWYELAYAEAKGRIKSGDRVWQIAFGSGFKCCSVVWRAIRNVDPEAMNPWTAEIDEFPVDLRNHVQVGLIPYHFEPSKQA
ncbi:3-ketoacyl-CoA synthase 20-like [Cornus florida]|uniref:3-ketoacyl-CoA synthase 20-like n=1 Tax=Cornus florida TaxID=4283 RepID=UPI0028A11632|nr:3-ketoacyl-CoA synthase 20-like [Cornus florida]